MSDMPLFEDAEDFRSFLSAARNVPYTLTEWEREVSRLERALTDAKQRRDRAELHGTCIAAELQWASGAATQVGF